MKAKKAVKKPGARRATAPKPAMIVTPPRPATPWKGQGGILCTLLPTTDDNRRDYYLVLANKKPPKPMTWAAAVKWAQQLKSDGHDDFSLPTRAEQAVLFGVLPKQFDPHFYWSNEPNAGNPAYAWGQWFYDGSQSNYLKSNVCRVRAVRRLPI